MKTEKFPLISRDISWLSFNDRVLQEAKDPSVPLLDRLKFLGIVSSNRDEFFRVRVATVKRMIRLGNKGRLILGEDPAALLEKIQEIVVRQQEDFDDTFQSLLGELQLNGIFIVNELQLSQPQGRYVRTFFRDEVQPALVPILLDEKRPFPYLRDRGIYFMVQMLRKEQKVRYALVEIPTDVLSRFVVLPKDNKYIILLDDVIRYCLEDLFFNFEYDSIHAYTIKLTRDAELDIEQDVTKSLVKKVSESIKRRKTGQPTRLVYDEEMPDDMLRFLQKKISIAKEDQPIAGGRYHNFVDFIRFPSLHKTELKYKPLVPLAHPDIRPRTSVLKVLAKKDVLISPPYQSYLPVIDVLREASIDPKVKAIQITLYRVANHSHIINSLINAIRNGKEVTAVIELQARFDEEANIRLANRLQDEGAKVIYGVPGLKLHSKLFLIHRMEKGKEVLYAHIGTGNFNEDTARLYADHSLLTTDKRLTEEVHKLFQFYRDNYKTGNYKHLVVSPFFMRKRLEQLIDAEIEHAKKGGEAWMFLKMNSLTDRPLIAKLYEASRAGVKIRLIVRSICSLVTGVPGFSENIEAISIVDKLLEHSRVFVFNHGGEHTTFLSSADWMTRNIDHRTEVMVPVYAPELKQQLMDILELQWSDNVKARVLNVTQDNSIRHKGRRSKLRAQDAIYQYFEKQVPL